MNTKLIKNNLIGLAKRNIISGITELDNKAFWKYTELVEMVKDDEKPSDKLPI